MAGPLDITAMIDVVLLLLIFFLLNSSFVLQPGIEVRPPRGLDSGVRDARYVIHITAEPTPRFFFNDQLVNREKLERQLTRLGRRTGESQVIIRADRSVAHGVVSDVLNMIIRSGLSAVIATEGA